MRKNESITIRNQIVFRISAPRTHRSLEYDRNHGGPGSSSVVQQSARNVGEVSILFKEASVVMVQRYDRQKHLAVTVDTELGDPFERLHFISF